MSKGHDEIDLQEEIIDVLKKEILPQISLWKPGEMKVHFQDLPLSEDYEENGETQERPFAADPYEDIYDKYLPCCIVKMRSGTEKKPDEPQDTQIDIIVIVKDWSSDMSGYKSLMIVLRRMKDYFLANEGLRTRFRLIHPIKWVVDDDAAIPYFIGTLQTHWATYSMPYNDIEGFL